MKNWKNFYNFFVFLMFVRYNVFKIIPRILAARLDCEGLSEEQEKRRLEIFSEFVKPEFLVPAKYKYFEKNSLDDVIKSCEEMSKNSNTRFDIKAKKRVQDKQNAASDTNRDAKNKDRDL